MTRIWLAAVASVTLLSGTAMAETTTTTTIETTGPYVAPVPAPVIAPVPPAPIIVQAPNPVIAPVPGPVAQTTTERTVEADGTGVVRSTTTVTGTSLNPLGETVTTRKTVETTTGR